MVEVYFVFKKENKNRTVGCYLYILRSELKETYYTGVSENTGTRIVPHNTSLGGYTQKYRPWILVYRHKFPSREQALAAERIVKGWKSKRMIRLLIDGTIRIENYL